ncbi:carbon storage regulator [uncultured Zhongshania sp.]
MLVLTVRVGESIYIDDDTVITIIDRWEDEVDLQIDTNQIITIDGTKP